MEGAPIDEAPASGQEPVGAPHEENPPHNDDNPVTKLFKDMGTKVKNVVAAVERMEEEVMDDKTVNDKVKAIQHTRNVKTLRQMWIDLILSKEFTTIIDQVFDKCCKLNDDDEDGHEGDGKLDRTELGAAMSMLWERLDQKTGGGKKLPRIKESEETVLRRYDADSDGHLDRDEFHGFARTYFRWVGAHPLPAFLSIIEVRLCGGRRLGPARFAFMRASSQPTTAMGTLHCSQYTRSSREADTHLPFFASVGRSGRLGKLRATVPPRGSGSTSHRGCCYNPRSGW